MRREEEEEGRRRRGPEEKSILDPINILKLLYFHYKRPTSEVSS